LTPSEVNNSFYPASCRKRRSTTGEIHRLARFPVRSQGSRFITLHEEAEGYPDSSSAKFFLVADRLEEKLGPILFQLPPRWKLTRTARTSFWTAMPSRA
jgi:uncharacterized protein YecE (DUF72 family)